MAGWGLPPPATDAAHHTARTKTASQPSTLNKVLLEKPPAEVQTKGADIPPVHPAGVWMSHLSQLQKPEDPGGRGCLRLEQDVTSSRCRGAFL